MVRQILAGHWLPAAAAALMLAGPACGHAKLNSSVPAADAQLRAAPTALTLTFNESVKIAVLTLSAAGRDIPVSVDRAAPAAPQVTVGSPALTTGRYLVRWSALSPADGHVSKGSFTFDIVGTAAPPPPVTTH